MSLQRIRNPVPLRSINLLLFTRLWPLFCWVFLQRLASSVTNPDPSAVLRSVAVVQRGQFNVERACPLRPADQ